MWPLQGAEQPASDNMKLDKPIKKRRCIISRSQLVVTNKFLTRQVLFNSIATLLNVLNGAYGSKLLILNYLGMRVPIGGSASSE